MEGGGFAAARPSIVKKEIGGALAWNRGHLLFKWPKSWLQSTSQLYIYELDAAIMY